MNSQDWCNSCQMYHHDDYDKCEARRWVAIVYYDFIVQAWPSPKEINPDHLLQGEEVVTLLEIKRIKT